MADKVIILEMDVISTSILFPGNIKPGCKYKISVTSVNGMGNSQALTIPFSTSFLTTENIRCVEKLTFYIENLSTQYKEESLTNINKARNTRKTLDKMLILLDMVNMAESTRQSIDEICKMIKNVIIDNGYSFQTKE